MSFLDILLGGLFFYSLYKGIKNGLFVELAYFLSLILGVYIAIEFSDVMQDILSKWFHWNSYSIQIIAFIITLIGVFVGVHLLGKFLTNLADFVFLGWMNSIGGGLFRALRTIVILSVLFTLFEKINYNNYLARKETLDRSLFYNPIRKVSEFIFPSMDAWYEKARD